MERKIIKDAKTYLYFMCISLYTPPPLTNQFIDHYTNELSMECKYPGNVWYGISITSFSSKKWK